MEPAHLITLLALTYSSWKDLKTRKGLHDKTYIAVILLITGSFLIQSPGMAGASLLQAILAILLGIMMRLVTEFGGADIWTLAIIAANFPDTIILRTIALTFIPYVTWLKIYALTGRKTAPAIPGLTAGFVLAITVL